MERKIISNFIWKNKNDLPNIINWQRQDLSYTSDPMFFFTMPTDLKLFIK